MLEFFGCAVLISSSIPTGDKPNCLFRGLIFLPSKEGVTQGNPLSMMLCSIAVLQLIHSLEDSDE